jgi:signal transduction histidine kinase
MNKNALIWLMLIGCVGFTIQAWSQDYERINKTKSALAHLGGDETRFNLLCDLAFEYRFAHPDSTIYFCSEAIALGKELNLKVGLARPINFVGVAYNYKGDRLTAYQAYSRALEVAKQQTDTLQIAHAMNNIGRVFFDQGLLSRSYDYFLDAIPLFEALSDSTGMAYGYQSLANLYRTQRDYSKAEEFFQKALAIRLKLKNTRDIMSAWVYLGRSYNESGNYPRATTCFIKADSGYALTNDEINRAETQVFLAENYIEDNKVEDAEKVFQRGYDVISKSKILRLQPRLFLTVGKIEFLKGNYKKAKEHLNQALGISKQVKDLPLQMNAHLYLSKVAGKLSRTSEELSNYNLYLILKDSLKDLDVARQVERLQFELKIEKKDQENKLLKTVQDKNSAIIVQQRYQNITLAVVAFSLFLVGVLIWTNSRKRKEVNDRLAKQNNEIENQQIEIMKQNEVLAKQNQLLSDLNHEKDTLMGIVAHDLKSPLNRIRGLLEVMRLEGGLDGEKTKLLKMVEDLTQTGIDLIRDLLDVHEIEENRNVSATTIDMQQFLQNRIDTFRSMAIAKGIDTKLHASPLLEVRSDQAYLNRIFDNLFSNAIKFSPRGSIIEIHSGIENEYAWVSVRDQGPGFQEFDKKLLYQKFKRLSARPTGGESSNGLGLAIVKTLVDRLKGEIILNTQPGEGSEFIVKFPRGE